MIYEPESFTPLLQLQQPTDTPISEQDKVLAEVMGSLQSTLDYLPAPEACELSRTVREQTIAQLKASEQWQTPQLPEECYFYHCNQLGLPDALINQNGEAVWAASYDAWGNVKEEHNPNSLYQPIRLPGQYHDPETNLYYNRHRYYDPRLGNYINQDPIGLASGEPNLTAYPRNPVQGLDPLGLENVPTYGDVAQDTTLNAASTAARIPNGAATLTAPVTAAPLAASGMQSIVLKDYNTYRAGGYHHINERAVLGKCASQMDWDLYNTFEEGWKAFGEKCDMRTGYLK